MRVPPSGLSTAEAELRLRRDGPNELPGQRPRNLLAITLEVIREPMFLLLLGASSIYVVVGDVREALILAASILVIVAITILQERRTERALAALRDLSSPRALVIRDGMERRIAGRDVVVGDVILLREGDRVPADAVILSSTALSVDESILTGESLAVDKAAAVDGETAANAVYSGSLVVRGFGVAVVGATGSRSEIGKIGRALLTLKSEPTPLFREVRRMVRWVALGALLLCAVVALAYALSRGDWLGGVLAGITLAMGVLPEEFPVVLTVFLALGAWRISRANVLTRRMPAVESIGAATVLAVDKTGTLTENRMKVALIETPDASVDLRNAHASLHENAELLLSVAFAASERDAFDPMERAIHEAARQCTPSTVASQERMELVKEYDLTPELLAVTHVWRDAEMRALRVAAKGAPEAIADLCGLDREARENLLLRVASHADQGLRVLAVAEGTAAAADLPETARGFQLRLLGLLCLADPLRADVPTALAECRQAGIRVVMITGDHPGTALAIASRAGFDIGGGVLTGVDLERASDDELRAHARIVNIYARAKPDHKLRLVQAFKANGEVIAMTGDGVNDAPALRAAHVGVAMGGRGTDVAREAAALVLVNDDFASLVTAVRLGRRIYSNIRHAMSYIVAVHIPIAGLGLLPVLFGWPLLFMPVHVLFLEFVIDPACAFVFEADQGAPDLMRRKPRPPNQRLFSRELLARSLALGFGVLLLCTAIYAIALRRTPPDEARALAFLAIVVCNLSLIFVSRSRSETLAAIFSKPNRVYWWIVALAAMTLATAIGEPAVADVFQFSRPAWSAVAAVTVAALSSVLALGLLLRNR
jgi:Ca2+-transporting ATPase